VWRKASGEYQVLRKSDMTKCTMWRGIYMRLVIMALILAAIVVLFPGCSGHRYTQTIKITAEPLNVSGLHTKVEYYRDAELVISIHFLDGNGDGIIDGKSGPKDEGNWPEGWEWFDDLYKDVIVGQSRITVTGEKVKLQDGISYEFLVGEYECERVK
jgi:hypothetical protein